MNDYKLNGFNGFVDLNKITKDIEYVDSEMTRIYNKLLEFEDLIEKFTVTENVRFSTILNNRIRYMREYTLLSIDLAKLVEKRREVLEKALEKEVDFLVTDKKSTNKRPLFADYAKDYEEEKQKSTKSPYEKWSEGINRITYKKGE